MRKRMGRIREIEKQIDKLEKEKRQLILEIKLFKKVKNLKIFMKGKNENR